MRMALYKIDAVIQTKASALESRNSAMFKEKLEANC